MLALTDFKILLFGGRLELGPAHQGPGRKRGKFSMKIKKTCSFVRIA